MSKVAFIYPGQGAQACGMGKDFYEQYPEAKELFDQASGWLGLDMKALCFEENELLHQTEFTQAAMVTTCLAMTKVLQKMGCAPDVTAGLSLGEYCAIAVAGGMTEETAIKTVRKRGIFMQEAYPAGQGAMAAVLGMEKEALEQALAGKEEVYIANYNCPGQLVITGKRETVEEVAPKLLGAGAKRVIPLNVSGPFHSPLLLPAAKRLGEELGKLSFSKLRIPYVTNVTAEYVTRERDIPILLERQVASSVRWEQSVRNMIDDGVDTFVEIGPGRTLTGFVKKIDKEVQVVNVRTVEEMLQFVSSHRV